MRDFCMKARTKFAAIALVAGLAVLSANAMAQRGQRAWKNQPPMSERAIVKPDTSQFGVKAILADGDTASALVQQARVEKLAEALSKCRTGEEFCKAALVAQRAFYKGRDNAHVFSLAEAIKTGKYDCRTLSAETWFDVAVRLGFDAKVVFVEDHLLLEVNGHCLEANRNEHYPSSQLARRHRVYLITADKKALMAIDYIDRGAEAWAAGDTASAIRYAKMAVECAPALPRPHENLSVYLEGVDLKASNEEHSTYLRLLPGMNATKLSASN